MERATYLLHQTPEELAKELIKVCPFDDGDLVVEPFRGEGAFYNNFPPTVKKDWAELEEGKDYTTLQNYDWVVSNPPFQLDTGAKKVNSFWFLLDYYSTRAKKGIAFLGNDSCFCTLTPNRIKILTDRGWYIQKVVVCAVKKWRGRYFFIVLQKIPNTFYTTLLTNY
jgi:hypothetical protein